MHAARNVFFAVHRSMTHTSLILMDYEVAKRIAQYFYGCMEHDDEMSTPLRIIRYNDADFAADKDDRKGISADIIYVISIIAGWNCKKQGTVALSAALLQFEDERH